MGNTGKSSQAQDFVLGAVAISRLQTISIDPRKFDVKAELEAMIKVDPDFMEKLSDKKPFGELLNEMKSNPATHEKFMDFLFKLNQEVKKQMEQQKPGSSQGINGMELAFIGFRSIAQTGFAHRPGGNDMICVVGTQIDSSESVAEIASSIGHVHANRLKPLPDSPALWIEFSGSHEGQHCNQTRPDNNTTVLQQLNREIEADVAGLARLRTKGHSDMAQAIIDLRIISAIMVPGDEHTRQDSLLGIAAIPPLHRKIMMLLQSSEKR